MFIPLLLFTELKWLSYFEIYFSPQHKTSERDILRLLRYHKFKAALVPLKHTVFQCYGHHVPDKCIKRDTPWPTISLDISQVY